MTRSSRLENLSTFCRKYIISYQTAL